MSKTYLAFFIMLLWGCPSLAQDTITRNVLDTAMLRNIADLADTIVAYSSQLGLDANVDYESKDSIRFNMITSEVYMYGDAKIKYDKIDLDAEFIKINFSTNELIAEGVKDSLGKLIGNPIFTQEDKAYNSKYMKYNYVTKKGYIKDVITEEGEGFLHGKEIMKLANDEINLKFGSFTTCTNEEHPHFEFRFNKSKVIPGKKIITGPAYLVIEGVSTPLVVPFGMFPNKTGQRSGIVMPTYGESANRGFFLENGGYYWAINDYFTFKITGDIYSRGSWAVKPVFNYKKRYKFQGSLDLSYAINKTGADNEDVSKDFSIRWSHSQDAKARPNSRFSANVNIVSRKANLFNPISTQDFLSSTFSSSVSYQTTIAKKFKLSANASHSQNTQTKKVTMSLPDISLSADRFYPFRKKGKAGALKWYDNISMNYSMNARNTVSIADSLLFKPEMFSQIKNGIKHSIPISSTVKILKNFNLTTSAQFTDRMYFNRNEKHWVTATDENGENAGYLQTDTVPGFYNLIDFGFSANLQTKIYGQKNFEKGALRAIRHVITPSVGFSYTPDFSEDGWGYYDYYYTNDDHTDSTQYSYYSNQIYGAPSNRESGNINFRIDNNLEIKVRSKKDTINGLKKIAIIDQFSISTSYDMVKDSMNWAPIRMSGRTKLFKKLDLNYSSTWSAYAADSTGKSIMQSEWKVNKKLLRLTNTSWRFGMSFSIKSKTKQSSTDRAGEAEVKELSNEGVMKRTSEFGTPAELRTINENPDQYVDWNIPWTLNIRYNFNYSSGITYEGMEKIKTSTIVQTLGFDGNISLTPKWKLEFRSGYDFKTGKISYTDFRILRDLHCWTMNFSWVPFGARKSWSFSLQVKASVLQDLKLDKKKDFRDNLR